MRGGLKICDEFSFMIKQSCRQIRAEQSIRSQKTNQISTIELFNVIDWNKNPERSFSLPISGKNRAQEAAAAAISSPLLDFPIEKVGGRDEAIYLKPA